MAESFGVSMDAMTLRLKRLRLDLLVESFDMF